jgi:bifunctional enzyme CysN/CysC
MQTEQMTVVFAGHVDHGKSTVIGRLLADTGSLPEGKLQQIRALCERTSKPFEYAFLLDALRDERAQGITIDAARVFFTSAKRRYLIIDAPGHSEFLRNMVTGASRAEAAFLVIDAKEGVRENTCRHGYLLAMLGIRKVVVLINKMDLISYSQQVFAEHKEKIGRFLRAIGVEVEDFIPISGRTGDNIVSAGSYLPWYEGATLLETLDRLKTAPSCTDLPFRMPVQDVYKFTRFGDNRRIVIGTILSGTLKTGDKVVFYPSGKSSAVRSIESFPIAASTGMPPKAETAGHPVGFTLEAQIYITRGEIAAIDGESPPRVARRLKVSLFWLGRQPMVPDKEYLLRLGTGKVACRLESIARLIDASTLASRTDAERVGRHEAAECVLTCTEPLAFDLHFEIAETGRFVLIDDFEISGGGIVRGALEDDHSWIRQRVLTRNAKWQRSSIPRVRRAERFGQKSALVLVTGPGESDKKQLAKALEKRLFEEGRLVYYLGLGSLLYGVDADLKSRYPDSRSQHRAEHLRRFAEVAHLMLDAGLILIATAIELNNQDLGIIKTVLQSQETVVVWSGDHATTDILPHLRILPQEPLCKAVGHIAALLREKCLVFKG